MKSSHFFVSSIAVISQIFSGCGSPHASSLAASSVTVNVAALFDDVNQTMKDPNFNKRLATFKTQSLSDFDTAALSAFGKSNSRNADLTAFQNKFHSLSSFIKDMHIAEGNIKLDEIKSLISLTEGSAPASANLPRLFYVSRMLAAVAIHHKKASAGLNLSDSPDISGSSQEIDGMGQVLSESYETVTKDIVSIKLNADGTTTADCGPGNTATARDPINTYDPQNPAPYTASCSVGSVKVVVTSESSTQDPNNPKPIQTGHVEDQGQVVSGSQIYKHN